MKRFAAGVKALEHVKIESGAMIKGIVDILLESHFDANRDAANEVKADDAGTMEGENG